MNPLTKAHGIRDPMSNELKFTTPIQPGGTVRADESEGRKGE